MYTYNLVATEFDENTNQATQIWQYRKTSSLDAKSFRGTESELQEYLNSDQ